MPSVDNPFGSPLTIFVEAETSGLESGIAGAISQLGSLKAAVGGAGVALAGLAAGGLAKSVSAASDFQNELIELEKVTNPETAAAMSDEIQRMAETIPLASSELAQIASDAGRFGVRGTENITSFTQAVSKMAVATDLTANEAGESLAKLAQLTGTPISEVENLGSSINELSNNMATSSSEIVDSMLRSSAAMSQFGLSQTEIAGFSGALNAVSESSERAGTRLRRLMQELSNPKKIDNIAGALGMTVSQFKAMQKNDPAGLLRTMAAGMADGGKTAENLNRVLSTTSRQALAGLGQNLDGLDQALDMSAKAFKENTSLQKEFDAASRTLSNQVQLLRNSLNNVAIQIGNVLLPVLSRAVGAIKVVVEWFSEINKSTNGVAGAVILLSTLFGGLVMAGGALVSALGGLSAVLGPIVAGFGALGTAIGILTGPIGWAIAGIAALGAAWATNFGGIQDATMRVVGFLQDQFVRVMQVAQAVIGPILADLASAFTGFGGDAESAFSRIVSVVEGFLLTAIQSAADFIIRTLISLNKWWQQHGDTVVSILRTFVDGIVTLISIGMAVINDIIGINLAVWRGDWSAAWEGIFNILGDILGRVAGFLERWFPGISTAMATRLIKWRDMWNAWGQQLGVIVSGALGFLQTTVIQPFLNWFSSAWNTYVSSALRSSGGLWNLLKQTVSSAVTFIWQDLLLPFVNWFGQMWTQHISGVLRAGLGLWQSYSQSVSQAISFVWNELLQPFISWFVSAFAQNISRVLTTTIGIWRMLSNTISTAVSFVWNELLRPFLAWFVSAWAQNFSRVLTEARTTWNALSQTIGAAITFIWNELLQPFISWFIAAWQANFTRVISEAAITWNVLSTKISAAVTTIWQGVIAPFINWFAPQWKTLWTEAQATLGAFFNWAMPKVQTSLQWLQNRWAVWGETIKQTARTLFEVLKLVIGQMMDVITTIIVVGLKLLRGDWEGAWMEVRNFFGRTKDRILSLASTLADSLVLWVKTLAQDIVNGFQWLYNQLVGGSIIPNMLSDIKNAFSRFGRDVVTWITNFVKNFVRRITNWANRVNTAFWNGLDRMYRALGRAGQQLKGRMGRIASGVVQKVRNVGMKMYKAGENLIQSIVRGVNNSPNAVKNAVASHVGKAAKFLPWSDAEEGPLSNLSESGPGLVRTLAQGIRAEGGRLSAAVREMAAGARAFLPSSDADTGPLSDIRAAGQSFGSTFAEGIRSSESEVTAAANSLAGAARGALGDAETRTMIQAEDGSWVDPSFYGWDEDEIPDNATTKKQVQAEDGSWVDPSFYGMGGGSGGSTGNMADPSTWDRPDWATGDIMPSFGGGIGGMGGGSGSDLGSSLGSLGGSIGAATRGASNLSRSANRAASGLSSAAGATQSLREKVANLSWSQRIDLTKALENAGFVEDYYLASPKLKKFAKGGTVDGLIEALSAGRVGSLLDQMARRGPRDEGKMVQAEDGSWVPESYYSGGADSGDQDQDTPKRSDSLGASIDILGGVQDPTPKRSTGAPRDAISILGGVSKNIDKLTSPTGGIGGQSPRQRQTQNQAPIVDHIDSLAQSNRKAIQRLEGEMAQRLDTLITHSKNSEGVVRIDGKKAGEVIESSMHRKQYSTEIRE